MNQTRFDVDFGMPMTPIQAVDLTAFMAMLVERDKEQLVQEMYFDRFEYMTTGTHKAVPSSSFANTANMSWQLLRGISVASPVIWDVDVLNDLVDGSEIFTGLPANDFIDLVDAPMIWYKEKIGNYTQRETSRKVWSIDADVVPFGFYIVPLKLYKDTEAAQHAIEEAGAPMVYTDKLSVTGVAIFLIYFRVDELMAQKVVTDPIPVDTIARMRFKALSLIKRDTLLSDDANCTFGAMMHFLHEKVKPENAVRLPRQYRRQLEREKRIVPSVYVIRLRRLEQGDKEVLTNQKGEINWNYKWYVRTHWRRQWYPSLGKHKPKLIERYLKNADTNLPLKPEVPIVYKADR